MAEQLERQRRVIIRGQEGLQNVLVAGQNYQKLILPTSQKSEAARFTKQLLLKPQTGQNIVLQNLQTQDKQKVLIAGQNGQSFLVDPQQLMVLGSEDMTVATHDICKQVLCQQYMHHSHFSLCSW